MPNSGLRQAQIERARPRRKPYSIRDGQPRGFGVRIAPCGRKRFFLHVQHEGTSQADIIRLLLLTGCRRGEILNLRWDEVHGDTLRLTDSKTGPRAVLLNTEAQRILTRQCHGNSRYVFPSPPESARPRSHELSLWYHARRRAGLEDVRLHDCRHTFASQAVLQGVPVPVVARLLGHRNAAMTLRYAHVRDPDVEAAAERIGTAIHALLNASDGRTPQRASTQPEALVCEQGRRARPQPSHDGGVEEPCFGSGRMQVYVTAPAWWLVWSVGTSTGARWSRSVVSGRPDGPQDGKKGGGEPLEIDRRDRQVGFGFHAVETTPVGAPEPVPGLGLAVEALGAPEVTLLQPLIVLAPPRPPTPGPEQRRVVMRDGRAPPRPTASSPCAPSRRSRSSTWASSPTSSSATESASPSLSADCSERPTCGPPSPLRSPADLRPPARGAWWPVRSVSTPLSGAWPPGVAGIGRAGARRSGFRAWIALDGGRRADAACGTGRGACGRRGQDRCGRGQPGAARAGGARRAASTCANSSCSG